MPEASDVFENGRHTRTNGGVGDLAAAHVQHDLIGVAGLGCKVALQQVGRPLRVGAGKRKVVDVVRLRGARGRHRDDQQRDPSDREQ